MREASPRRSARPVGWPVGLVVALLSLLLVGAGAPAAAQEAGPRIYISADMEGLAGAVTGDQLGPSGFEYGRFREFMTGEVLAAIRGARAAGAGEILVSDSHGNGENLLIERLPPDIRVVRSWPRPLMMMQGVEEGFDGAIFIGYHAGTTSSEGVRAHTMSSARLADIRLNGTSMSEAGINAAIAGHFDVPVIMISGDGATIDQARELIGDFEAAVVKESYSFHSAKTMTPEAARELIEERARTAVERLDDFEPMTVATPVTLDVRFKNYRPSQVLSYLRIVERPDAHSIRFVGDDMVEVSKFLEFMLSFQAGLEP